MPFTTIQPGEIGDCIDRIGRQWMLITAGDEQHFNTMTASWGGMGTLFNKPVATIYVRPQRYTYQFTEQQDTFSLCFFDPCYRDTLTLCGTKSGRDIDKPRACGLDRSLTQPPILSRPSWWYCAASCTTPTWGMVFL